MSDQDNALNEIVRASERVRQLRDINDDPFETTTQYRQRILREERFSVNINNLDQEYLDNIYRQDNINFFLRQGYTEIDAHAYIHQVVAYGLAQAKEDGIVPANRESWMQVRNLEPFDFNRVGFSFVHDDTSPLESWNFNIPNNDLERAHLEGTGGYTPSHEIEIDLDRRIINAVAIIYGMECMDNEGSTGVYPVGHIQYMAGNVRVIDIYDSEDFYYTKGSLCVAPILVKRFDRVQIRFKLARPLPVNFSIRFRGFILKRKQEVANPPAELMTRGAPIRY